MFSAEKIVTIFGNIEEIYQFAKAFFDDLEKHVRHHQPEMSELGSCFLRHVSMQTSLHLTQFTPLSFIEQKFDTMHIF